VARRPNDPRSNDSMPNPRICRPARAADARGGCRSPA
jgi:hypothetical protein